MPSWILPGRKDAPITRYKAILEKSFAYSRTFNQRNPEYNWYSLWNQTLSDLVSDIPNVIVAPQYPVWFIPQNDEEIEEDEGDGDGNDPEEIEVTIGGSHHSRHAECTLLEVDDEDGVDADVSFASTTPEKDAKSVIVDFAIINLSAVPLHQPRQKVRYGGWKITQANVGLLVEIKRFVSRGLTDAESKKALEGRIIEAHDDLVTQAAHLFLQDEGKDSVLAIAAAGISSMHFRHTCHDSYPLIGLYWCSTKISRGDVKKSMRTFRELDTTYQGSDSNIDNEELKWSSLLRLDLARSNDRLHTIYKSLKESGVLRTPGDV